MLEVFGAVGFENDGLLGVSPEVPGKAEHMLCRIRRVKLLAQGSVVHILHTCECVGGLKSCIAVAEAGDQVREKARTCFTEEAGEVEVLFHARAEVGENSLFGPHLYRKLVLKISHDLAALFKDAREGCAFVDVDAAKIS